MFRYNMSCRKTENIINLAQTAHEQPTDQRSFNLYKEINVKINKKPSERNAFTRLKLTVGIIIN